MKDHIIDIPWVGAVVIKADTVESLNEENTKFVIDRKTEIEFLGMNTRWGGDTI